MDASAMLRGIQTSAQYTLEILKRMQDLAVDACDATRSNTERSYIDVEFQVNKKELGYIQSVGILNGQKVVTGGDLSIQFGDENNEMSSLTVKIPSFDPASLGVPDLSVSTVANAENSLNVINDAITKMNAVVTAVNLPAIDDANAMLQSIPFVLSQDYQLLQMMLELAVQSANATQSSDERVLLDMNFDYFKSALVKTQTYVSYNGPKMLGGGKIHIQIGKYAKPETTLDINVPVTDMKKLGMDKLNIRTVQDAEQTFESLNKDMYDFAYGS
jgi:flagellin-like hook-associated protein FlgL